MAQGSASEKPPRVLAIASGGGHWVQLLRLRPAWEGATVTYASTVAGYRQEVQPHRFHTVRDASRWNKFALAIQALQVAMLVLRVRPNVIVSTGASVGYFAVRVGRLIGARAVWVDSIANAEELSMTAQLAGPHVTAWFTQWPELAKPNGPECHGAVL